MFRFTWKPSSGSRNQYLAKITNLVQLCVSVEMLLVWRDKKTNKMQRLDFYYQLLSQPVSGIIMPIFRKNKDRVLLHTVYCSGSAGCGW